MPKCRHGCRFIPITENLLLCPHSSYGSASWKLGAVEEGRRLLERAGGYDALLAKIEKEENERKEKRKRDQEKKQQRVRYG